MQPAIKVYGAEPEAGNDVQRSLRSGQIVSIDVPKTILRRPADAGGRQLPGEVIRTMVSDVLTAADATVIDAMRFAFERMKLVLEPSGACALAALMANRTNFAGQRGGSNAFGWQHRLRTFLGVDAKHH